MLRFISEKGLVTESQPTPIPLFGLLACVDMSKLKRIHLDPGEVFCSAVAITHRFGIRNSAQLSGANQLNFPKICRQ